MRFLVLALIVCLCGCASVWQDFKTSITPPEYDVLGQNSRHESVPSSGAHRVGAATCVRSGAVSQCAQRYSDGSTRRFSCRSNGPYTDCR